MRGFSSTFWAVMAKLWRWRAFRHVARSGHLARAAARYEAWAKTGAPVLTATSAIWLGSLLAVALVLWFTRSAWS